MTIRETTPGPAVATPAVAAVPSGLPSAAPTASYWLQTPSPVLRGFRSTASLPAAVDVAIVGSGITGAFAADALAATGVSVVVLEAREFCFGATGRNGGHCHPSVYGNPADVADFELATFRFLRDFVAAHHIACDWRTLPGGGVHAYLDDDLFAAAAALVAQRARTRPDLAALARVVPADATAALAADDLRLRHAAGAVVQTHAASVWPYRLVSWVLERLARSCPTVNLQATTPVTRLSRAPSSSPPSDDAGVWHLETPRGTVAARRVLLATNAYTSHLVPTLADLIVPVRGQVAALVPPGGAAAPPQPVCLSHSYVFLGHDRRTDEADRDEYLVQQPIHATGPTGHLVLGGGRQRAAGRAVGEWRDDVVEADVATYLRSHLVPVLELDAAGADTTTTTTTTTATTTELPADFEWTGIMGFSRDQNPWVGLVPVDALGLPDSSSSSSSLFLCAGYTGHGMPRAALAARIVASQILASLGHSATLSPTVPEDAVPLPAAFAISSERIQRVRATCAPVVEADQRGLLAEFQEALAENEPV